MAKISVEFDTVTKDLSVVMDGQPVENVREISCYSYDENKGSVEIRTVETMQDDGMMKVVRILANEKTETLENTERTKDLNNAMARILGKS